MAKPAALATGRRGSAPVPRRALLSDSAESALVAPRGPIRSDPAPPPPAEILPKRRHGPAARAAAGQDAPASLGWAAHDRGRCSTRSSASCERTTQADLNLIARAYKVAEQCHRGQVRISGDAYITTPPSVTTILAELGMTEPTLCAALLHDTWRTARTPSPSSPTISVEIALLVDGYTKLEDQVRRLGQGRDHPQDDLGDEPRHRVLVIKLADRLHNMRT